MSEKKRPVGKKEVKKNKKSVSKEINKVEKIEKAEKASILKGGLLPITELFSRSFESFKKDPWRLMGMTLLTWLIPMLTMMIAVVVASIFVFVTFGRDNVVYYFNSLEYATTMPASLFYILLGAIAIGVLFGLLSLFFQYAMMLFISQREDKNITIKEALMMARDGYWGFVWVRVLTGLLILGGFILFIIPGIILALLFSFSSWVYIRENRQGMEALMRSKELVSGYWWAVFGRYAVVILIAWAIMLVVSIFAAGLGRNTGAVTASINLIEQVISLVLAPLFFIYHYYIYLDLKKVKGEK